MSSNNLSAPANTAAPISSPNAVNSQHAPASMIAAAQQQQQQQPHAMATSNTTAPYLKDFNLVAEAAKRAQMAVLMRDIDEITL